MAFFIASRLDWFATLFGHVQVGPSSSSKVSLYIIVNSRGIARIPGEPGAISVAPWYFIDFAGYTWLTPGIIDTALQGGYFHQRRFALK